MSRSIFAHRHIHALRLTRTAFVVSNLFSAALAGGVDWTGATDTNLANAANWQQGTTPGTADTATFNTALPATLNLTSAALSVYGMTFGAGANASTLSLSATTSTSASLSIGAGGLTNNAPLETFTLAAPNTALNFSGIGSAITGSGSTSIQNQSFYATTTFAQGASAGSAHITNTSGGSTLFQSASAGTSTLSTDAISTLFFAGAASAANARIYNAGTLGFSDTSDAGQSLISNTGEVVFAASASAASSTINNQHDLLLGNAATLGGATVYNSGAVTLSNSSNAGTAQIINGTGGVVSFNDTSSAAQSQLTNLGTVAFAGTASAAQASIQNSGLIDLSAMSAPLTIGALNGSGNVTLGANSLTLGALNTDEAIAGAISGVGTLNKTGTGTLTLSGSSTFSGGLSVNAGALNLSGSVLAPISVASGATLAGSGTAGGNVTIASQGQFSPASAGQTFHIGGNLTLASGALFNEVVTPASAALTQVAGSATIAGATLQVIAQGTPSNYAAGTSYVIVNASGGVSGTFASTASNLALLAPHVQYMPDEVVLSFTQLPVNPNGNGGAINSMVGGATSTGGTATGAGALTAGLDNLSLNQLSNALSTLGASTYSVLREDHLLADDAFARRVAEHGVLSVDSAAPSGWLAVEGQSRSADGGFNAHSAGLIGGIDVMQTPDTRVALAAQYLLTNGSLNSDNATGASLQVGLYGNRLVDDWLFSGLLGAGSYRDDVHRFIDIGSYVAGPTSRPKGQESIFYGEVGRQFMVDGFSTMPYLSLNTVMESDGDFEEGGGSAADLMGAAHRAVLLENNLGVRVFGTAPLLDSLIGSNKTTVAADLAFEHAFADRDGRTDAHFLADPNHVEFMSTASVLPENRLLASLDLETDWQHGWRTELKLAGEVGSHWRSIEAHLGIGYFW